MSNNETPSTTPDIVLPELTDATVDELEQTIFARIADERVTTQARKRRRKTTTWLTAAAAAVVVVGAAAVGPTLLGSDTTTSAMPGVQEIDAGGGSAPDFGVMSEAGSGEESSGYGGEVKTAQDPIGPQIITTVNTTLEVKDVAEASTAIAAYAQSAGGYVESEKQGEKSAKYRAEDTKANAQFGTITIRIPSDRVTEATDKLLELGTVVSTSSDRYDVTIEMVDLNARTDSLRASVERLKELRDQAGSLADLLAAETALTERQAELDGLVQQQTYLSSQVQMSTITITLRTQQATVTANPVGFTDGIVSGWNGLVATLNGAFIGFGFLLPWLAVLGVVGLIVWLISRARRTRATPES